MNDPVQAFTGFPPSVYMHFFIACEDGKPCTQTDTFHLDELPKGCCLLLVTNGDGRGNGEVIGYEVFFNDERAVSTGETHAPVKLLKENTVRVTLHGKPHTKIFVLISYDPREDK